MNELHEDLDRALRTLPVSEAPVERAKHDGRRRRNRRRAGVVAGALAVIAVAAGYPALAGNFAAAPPSPTVGRPAPAHDPKVTDSVPSGTTRTVAGLATTGDVVAVGTIGKDHWLVQVDKEPSEGAAAMQSQFCYTPATAGNDQCSSILNLSPPVLGSDPVDLIGMSDAIVGPASGKVSANEEVEAGLVARDVTYLTVTFADGQQLKLTPVALGGQRYAAWAAPESMTVASVTAYLGGPYTASGQTETAIPFNGAGLGPSISLWLRPGQAPPPRGQALIGHGTGDGQGWSVTAYEGPWGTCFAISGGTGMCISQQRLATTGITDSIGGPGSAGEQLGSAAPGVGLLRFALSNGKSLDVTPVTVGNERLFAFWLAQGATAVSWTAYSAADGRQVGHGKA